MQIVVDCFAISRSSYVMRFRSVQDSVVSPKAEHGIAYYESFSFSWIYLMSRSSRFWLDNVNRYTIID